MSTISKSGIRALLITLFTMLIISSLVVLVKAKNSSGEVKKVEKTTVTTTTWYFTGISLDDALIASPENWTKIDPQLECGTGDDLPCTMPVDNADDHTSLQQFLNGKTAAQIRDVYASSKRAE